MNKTIWLRAETKPLEARSAITPGQARELRDSGAEVVVEASTQRAIPDSEYEAAGCRMAAAGAWTQAPDHVFVLGVKDLPHDSYPLRHRHIYFGHAFKEQEGWRSLLRRFRDGGGKLLDLEYLVDGSGRRVAAFGYWAGFTGCAVGVKTWVGQKLVRDPVVAPLSPYPSKDQLIKELGAELESTDGPDRPSVIVIGANGRVGTGACDLAENLGLTVTRWDLAETAPGGPFREILAHDIFVNCVLVQHKIPPFLDRETVADPGRALTVVSDVSCDPGELNPVPLYTEPTTFAEPTINVIPGPPRLDLTAIDHLPSMLPVEATEDFGRQLLPYLIKLNDTPTGVWERSLRVFDRKIGEI